MRTLWRKKLKFHRLWQIIAFSLHHKAKAHEFSSILAQPPPPNPLLENLLRRRRWSFFLQLACKKRSSLFWLAVKTLYFEVFPMNVILLEFNFVDLRVLHCCSALQKHSHHTINRAVFVCLFVPLLLWGPLTNLRQTWWVYVGGPRNCPWGVLFLKGQRVNGSKVTFSEEVTRRYIIW